MIDALRFLGPAQARALRDAHGSPLYVYDERTLRRRAASTLAFPNAFGLTVRYAMKAAPNRAILRLFSDLGLHIDASSGHEVERALRAGVPAAHISLSAQELPADIGRLLRQGVHVNACSLHQIDRIGGATPGGRVGLRVNPGLGSGSTNRTNVGGPSSSFGIWHEHLGEARARCAAHGLTVDRVHTHIGSGSDPAVWQRAAQLSLESLRHFPDAHTLDLGGGFKTARMVGESETDLQEVGAPVRALFKQFAADTGREIHLEIEPGTYLVANAACLLATVQDATDTGEDGYRFLKLDCGMTEILRPSLYGAQHPIVVVPAEERDESDTEETMVVGHCCESGDILTPAPGDPEGLQPRRLARASIGDIAVIEAAGAYCSAMAALNYNSFPATAEVLLQPDGATRLIRRRQTLDHMLANECDDPVDAPADGVPDHRDYLAVNHANWESRVPVHAASAMYRLDRYIAEPDLISEVVEFDRERLGDIAGLDLVHLQCHLGTDSLSLARLGAKVTGLDFSGSALEHARRVSAAGGPPVEYIEADVYDAVEALGRERFDRVYTGIGALGWLPSVKRWAEVVGALLRPGGELFIREGHPVLWALDEPRPDLLPVLEFPYFETAGLHFRCEDTYVEHDAPLTSPDTICFNHGMAEILNAIWSVGLEITLFEEHRTAPWNPLGGAMVTVGGGEWQLRDRPDRLPCTYTLRARKP